MTKAQWKAAQAAHAAGCSWPCSAGFHARCGDRACRCACHSGSAAVVIAVAVVFVALFVAALAYGYNGPL